MDKHIGKIMGALVAPYYNQIGTNVFIISGAACAEICVFQAKPALTKFYKDNNLSLALTHVPEYTKGPGSHFEYVRAGASLHIPIFVNVLYIGLYQNMNKTIGKIMGALVAPYYNPIRTNNLISGAAYAIFLHILICIKH